MTEPQPANTPNPSWRESRRQEHRQRRAERGANAWIIGAVLVGVGVLLMMQNLSLFPTFNAWALLGLIPAAGCFAAAWRNFNNNGEIVSGGVIAPFLAGLVFIVITGALLLELNLDWALVVPALLILAGVSVLFGAFAWRR